MEVDGDRERGVSPNPLIPQAFTDLEVTSWGTIVVNSDTMQTADDRVYAGGYRVGWSHRDLGHVGDGKRGAKQCTGT